MRGFCVARRSCVAFSFELRLALVAAVLAVDVAGCSRKDPGGGSSVSVSTSALNTSPKTTDFAVYAQNSATLRDRTTVSGGDVGVRLAGSGPFLVAGYELALVSDVQVDTTRSVIANRLLLQDRARVGDVQVNHLTNQAAFYSHQYPFPSSMPALPPTAPVSPGTPPLAVNASTTVVASPGSYGAVSVGTQGILRLKGGVYELASLQLNNDARPCESGSEGLSFSSGVATAGRGTIWLRRELCEEMTLDEVPSDHGFLNSSFTFPSARIFSLSLASGGRRMYLHKVTRPCLSFAATLVAA